jgi:Tfp pilus assembly protein FimV
MNIELVTGGLVLLAVLAYEAFRRSPKSLSKPSMGKEAPSKAKDLLAEVDVFLAYEQFSQAEEFVKNAIAGFSQAEEFVKNAIAGDPDNLDIHAKLLEVFYAACDKKGYEEAAKVLHDKVHGQGPYWDMALAMWQGMSPNRALLEADE